MENEKMNKNIINDNSNNRGVKKSWTVTLILAILFGMFGFHRFYVNKGGTGILYLLTFGFFGIGWIIDIIMISCKSFRDGYGNIID